MTSGRREEEEKKEKEGADNTLKTKTPHVNVGKKLQPRQHASFYCLFTPPAKKLQPRVVLESKG